jgi:hypothetical protein
MKPRKDKDGYLLINLNKKTCKVSREVGFAFIPNPLNLPQINHKNGDKTNNNDWNLEWSTHRDNCLHAFATGLNKTKGTGNAMARFTDEQIIEIRNSSKSRKEIAAINNVNEWTISRIINKITYKKLYNKSNDKTRITSD